MSLISKKGWVSSPQRNIKRTPEWNAKIASSNIGKVHSKETRKRISEANKRQWESGIRTHKTHLDAMKKAVQTKRDRGYYELHSVRHSQWMKINAPMRGKKHNDETRQKMRDARQNFFAQGGTTWMLGKTHSQKTKEMLSTSASEMWKNGKFGYGNNGPWRSKLEISIYEEFLKHDPKTQHSVPIVTSERTYVFDIYVPKLNLLIEINGDYCHLNPRLYEASHVDRYRNITAQEVWDRDANKRQIAESQGYRVITIWENEVKNLDPLRFIESVFSANKNCPRNRRQS